MQNIDKIKIIAVGLNMINYDKEFIENRRETRDKAENCYLCERKFIEGEKASFLLTKNSNKVICSKCAEELKFYIKN